MSTVRSRKSKVKLSDFARVITPQVGVELVVKKQNSKSVLWSGPAHYLTGGESFCENDIRSISIEDNSYVIII